MQFTVTVTAALAALCSLATVTVASALPAGSVAFSANTPFTVNSTLKWTGPSKGVNITLLGTSVTDIAAQLKALDPNWQPVKRDLTKNSKRQQLPGEPYPATPNCCPIGNFNWPNGNAEDLMNLIDAVEAIGGTLGVNPNSCILTDCINGTGAWACNQLSESYLEIYTDRMGQYVGDIWEKCSGPNCGQDFDPSGEWNIIAHGGC